MAGDTAAQTTTDPTPAATDIEDLDPMTAGLEDEPAETTENLAPDDPEPADDPEAAVDAPDDLPPMSRNCSNTFRVIC